MARASKYDLDLTASKPRMTVRVDVGGGPEDVELLEPRRREARALDACAEAAKAGGGGFVDALYATAAAVLSRNARGREFSADEVADALSVADANALVAAYAGVRARQEDALGNA